jgi:transposase
VIRFCSSVSWGNPTRTPRYPEPGPIRALFVGLDVSLRTTSICVVEPNGSTVWEGKAESEPARLIKALLGLRGEITLIGIEACPLSERLYGALVESSFKTVCIETRHAQRFLSSRPNKTDRSDARGIADMIARAKSGARQTALANRAEG